MSLSELLPIIIPLLLVQLVLIVIAIRDLMQPDRVVLGGSKLVWGVIIVLGELLGPLIYFVIGRRES